jgi:hypothetical protein
MAMIRTLMQYVTPIARVDDSKDYRSRIKTDWRWDQRGWSHSIDRDYSAIKQENLPEVKLQNTERAFINTW